MIQERKPSSEEETLADGLPCYRKQKLTDYSSQVKGAWTITRRYSSHRILWIMVMIEMTLLGKKTNILVIPCLMLRLRLTILSSFCKLFTLMYSMIMYYSWISDCDLPNFFSKSMERRAETVRPRRVSYTVIDK